MADQDEPIPTRAEPHDLAAEQALIGRIIIGDTRRLLREITVTGADYYRPAHAVIHRAIQALSDSSEPVDLLTIAARLQAHGDTQRAGGFDYLNQCVEMAAWGGSVDWLDHRLRDLALRRALIKAGTRIREAGFQPDSSADASDLAEQAVAELRQVRDAGRAADDAPVQDIHDFLATDDPEHDWTLPGYLEHTDRIVWTAGEGGGKSVLQRQIGVTGAAGLLPFGGTNELGPQRVLILDCENSARQSRRHYQRLIDIAEHTGTPVKRGQLHIDLRPEGVDLTRGDGRAWLMRRVEAVMPDLLIVGPIYRLHTGDPNSEEHARKITVVLDEARATASCALSMEAHSPQGGPMGPRALRPTGSSLWLRWPEFGLGLRPVEDERSAADDRARRVLPWRGARDERAWPHFIRQGDSGNWPWRTYRPIDADQFTGHSPTGAVL